MKPSECIQTLQDALTAAAQLDAEQDHNQAAIVLTAAIAESNVVYARRDWCEADLLRYASLAQQCGREKDRQEYRQAKLNSYLYG